MVDVRGPRLMRARTIWTRACASRLLLAVELIDWEDDVGAIREGLGTPRLLPNALQSRDTNVVLQAACILENFQWSYLETSARPHSRQASLLAERRARRGAHGREMRRAGRDHRARLRRGGSPGRWDREAAQRVLFGTTLSRWRNGVGGDVNSQDMGVGECAH